MPSLPMASCAEAHVRYWRLGLTKNCEYYA
jgi:hypothetical protein